MQRAHKIILLLGAVLLVLLLIPLLYDAGWVSRNKSYIEELVARGEPMTLEQLRPPAIPPSENSAGTFLKAVALLDADKNLLTTNVNKAMQMISPGKAVVCSQASMAAGWEGTNSWAEVERVLADNQPALALLQQLAAHPAIDFHIHYERVTGHGFDDYGSLKLSELQYAAESLSWAISSELHDGDASEAITNERAQLALAKATQFQRFAISDLFGMAIFDIAEGTTWEIIHSTNLAEPQLTALQREWERVDYIRNWEKALAMERLEGEMRLACVRRATAAPGAYVGIGKNAAERMGIYDSSTDPTESARKNGLVLLWRVWWSYLDELRSLRGYEVLLKSTRFVATNECFDTAISNQTAELAALQITKLPMGFYESGDLRTIMSYSVESLMKDLEKVMAAESGRQMTITAIALQRFKLAHGHFPARLSELVPQYVAAVPPDPVDGRPLRYHLQTDGTFCLYSVGENGVDDGGNPTSSEPASLYWLNPHALDWVWPQAVSGTNIQLKISAD